MDTHGMSKHDKWLTEEMDRRRIAEAARVEKALEQHKDWLNRVYAMAEAAYSIADAEHRKQYNGWGIPGDPEVWIEGWYAGFIGCSEARPTA